MSWFVTVRHPPVEQQSICYGRADVEAAFSFEQLDSLLAQLARLSLGGGPRRVVSSPARRCHRLAIELSVRLGLPLDVDERLCELAFGQWEGRSWRELEQEPSFQAWMRDWKCTAPPGGESLADLHARVREWLEEAVERGVPTLVITHAGVVRSLRVRLAGWSWERAFREVVPCLAPQLWNAGGADFRRT